MTQARGSSGRILIQKETTFNTDPVTPATKVVPFISEGLRLNRQTFQSNVITSNRNPSKSARGDVDVSGSIVTEAGANVALLFEAALGSCTTTGADPYTHTITVGSSLSSYLIEKQFTDISQYFKYNGCKVSSMTLDVTPSGFQNVTFNWMAAKETASGTSYETGTPTSYDKVSFDGYAAAIFEGGSSVANVTGISGLTIDNGLDGGQYVIGGQGVRQSIPEGMVRVSGTLTAFFENLTYYNKAVNHTESSLKVTFTNGTGDGSDGNEYLEIFIPELVYSPSAPVISGPTGVLVELPFEAYFSDSSEASAMQIVVKNGIAAL